MRIFLVVLAALSGGALYADTDVDVMPAKAVSGLAPVNQRSAGDAEGSMMLESPAAAQPGSPDPPADSPLMQEPHVVPRGISLALLDGEILFGIGQYELTPQGEAALSNLIDGLQRFERILSIRVVGHTDNLGSADVNLRLSEGRARWISERFSARYPETHIMAIGAGENAPLFSNETIAGRTRNRRVEVQVIALGKPITTQ